MRNALRILPLVLLAGCVTAKVAPLSGKAYAPVAPESVTIYLDEDDVPREYEQVAIIYLSGDYQMTAQDKMVKKARKKAAELGANGLILGEMREPSTGAKVAQYFVGTGADRKTEAIAIFVPPSPRAAAD